MIQKDWPFPLLPIPFSSWMGVEISTLVTMGEDNAGTRNLPEAQNDPLNVAFDKKSGSLFVSQPRQV